MQSPAGELTDKSFPVVEVDASVNDVTRGLHRSPAVLVEEYKRIVRDMMCLKRRRTRGDDEKYVCGLSALLIWNHLARVSYDKQIKKALHTQRIAGYAHRRLKHLEKKLNKDLWVARSPLSLTVRFKQAKPEIIFKYSLSGETFYVDGRKRAYNHIFTMSHVTEETIDRLIEDLSRPGAFPKQNAENDSTSVTET